MAAVFGPRDIAVDFVAEIPGLTIGANNSHHCVVAAGSFEALRRLVELAPAHKPRVRQLDLVYPFHSPLMQPVREPLLESLADVAPSAGSIPFLSTVTGDVLPGVDADAAYWWLNVRETVLFQEAVERALHLGKRVFLEIGPRPTVKTHVRDAAEHLDAPALVDCVLDEDDDKTGHDPFESAAARLLGGGAEIDAAWAFGPDPWRRQPFRFAETSESTGEFSLRPRHPLIGARDDDATLEWRAILDTELEPALADHQVRGQTMLPGAAFSRLRWRPPATGRAARRP
jgi:acyl transferase domain-containing protein